jgi:hypothetical protein
VVAGVAVATTGDQWLGLSTQAVDGARVYQNCANEAEWSDRTITVTLRNERTGSGSYTIQARGGVYGYFAPEDGGLPSGAFGFEGKATLSDARRKVRCRGAATAGGMPAHYYMRVAFGPSCPLPGAHVIELSQLTGTANLRVER